MSKRNDLSFREKVDLNQKYDCEYCGKRKRSWLSRYCDFCNNRKTRSGHPSGYLVSKRELNPIIAEVLRIVHQNKDTHEGIKIGIDTFVRLITESHRGTSELPEAAKPLKLLHDPDPAILRSYAESQLVMAAAVFRFMETRPGRFKDFMHFKGNLAHRVLTVMPRIKHIGFNAKMALADYIMSRLGVLLQNINSAADRLAEKQADDEQLFKNELGVQP